MRAILPLVLWATLATIGAATPGQVDAAQAPARATAWCPMKMPSGAAVTCACAAPDLRVSTVWGTYYYTDDSALCAAALHAGVIGGQGGLIEVRRAPRQPYYVGSRRNGVSSNSLNPSAGATIVFTGDADPEAVLGRMPLCPYSLRSGGPSALACRCLPGTALAAVYGSGPYAADSHICSAARHAGAIGAGGGALVVRAAPGQSRYAASTRNGVTTSTWGSYPGSFTVAAGPVPTQGQDRRLGPAPAGLPALRPAVKPGQPTPPPAKRLSPEEARRLMR